MVLILSQLPTVTGYDARGANRVTQTIDLLSTSDEVHLASLRRRGAHAGDRRRACCARGCATSAAWWRSSCPPCVVALRGARTMSRSSRDVGDIPRRPAHAAASRRSPTSRLDVLYRCALARVRRAGPGRGRQPERAESGRRAREHRRATSSRRARPTSRPGLFRGVPVGGSLGATALNVVSGASRRWAAILAGAVDGGDRDRPRRRGRARGDAVAGRAPDPRRRRRHQAGGRAAVWQRRLARPRWPAVTTFLATLVLPIQVAVGLGVLLSALLYVDYGPRPTSRSSSSSSGRTVDIEERNRPRELPGGEVDGARRLRPRLLRRRPHAGAAAARGRAASAARS